MFYNPTVIHCKNVVNTAISLVKTNTYIENYLKNYFNCKFKLFFSLCVIYTVKAIGGGKPCF